MPQFEDLLGTSCHRQNSLLDQAIETYTQADKNLSPAEEQGLLNHISCLASVDATLLKYYEEASDWKTIDFRNENHCSTKLGKNMERAGKKNPYPPRPGKPHEAPNRIEAHHIIPGDDKRFEKAVVLRARLARAKVRSDDPDNGVWLPKTPRDKHPDFPKAVPHRRIHREGYYRFLSGIFLRERSPVMFRVKLNLVGQQLQAGDTPDWMMLPKNQLPENE
jgi:hypothetical protein